MAEVHSVVGRMNAAGAVRLTVALAQAFADGDDLGPRTAHIRTLCLSIDGLADALRTELVRLDAVLAEAGIRSSGHPRLHALLVEVERMAASARAFRDLPVADVADPTGGSTS